MIMPALAKKRAGNTEADIVVAVVGLVVVAVGRAEVLWIVVPRTAAQNPGYANAYNNRGIAYKNKGDLDRAITDYNKAIEIDPKLVTAYYNRAYAYERKGDKARAIDDYRRAYAINPSDPDYTKALKRLGAEP